MITHIIINHIWLSTVWFVTSKSLKIVLGYDLGDFSVVWGVSTDPERDKSYAYLPNLVGNQIV